MGIAAFKDLCLDASDAVAVGRFWSEALGLPLERRDDGDTVVRGDPLHSLWIDRVPEAKAVKNRVHLDVRGRHADDLVALGATVLADHGDVVVLGDPEGNELCLFPEPDRPDDASGLVTPFALCVDSVEPEALAAWWAGILGGEVGPGPDGVPRYVYGAAGFGDLIMKCVPVDDRRVAKNRCHWDVTTADVRPLVAAGATVLRPRDAEIGWTVLADPQGNEFCAFTPG